MADALEDRIGDVVDSLGYELFDLDVRNGFVVVTVDRPGGVDLDALTAVNRGVSAVLDELDPFPGHYTLEVTSPGVERNLRRPAHFEGAVGERVKLKTAREVEGERRFEGILEAADETSVLLRTEEGERRFELAEVERARTVFTWGPARGAERGRKRSEHEARVTTR